MNNKNRIQLAIKYLKSFLKADWEIRDYPLCFRHFEQSELSKGAFIPCIAQVVNWWQMTGSGDTREEALRDLEKNFDDYKTTVGRPPRPGKRPRA